MACLGRLGARPRLAGRRPGGVPDRVRAHPATGGRVQPALLVICLAATIGFATVSGGRRACWPCCRGRTVLVLVGSVAVLVPIQRRLVASGPHSSLADITRWRAQWLRGHLLRTAAMAFFVPAVIAIVV